MARVMLVQPWSYHDEGRAGQDLSVQGRNGPYSLVLLGTSLRAAGHDVGLVDLIRDLIVLDGSPETALDHLADEIAAFRPDILGVGFFSVHYLA